MSNGTAIEWSDATWNPTTGCDRVSPGCGNALEDGTEHGDCYALTLARRLKAMGSAKYQNDGDPETSGPGFLATEHPEVLREPLKWRKPRKVFVNSMSDLFHDRISDAFIADVWSVMARTPRHTYQVLTKRHGRMRSLLNRPSFHDRVAHLAVWPLPNVWLGVSVEDQKRADLRVIPLLDTPAAVRFVSCEPLLGPVDLRWCGGVDALRPDWTGGSGGGTGAPHPLLDWVIAGGESGDDFLPVNGDWIRSLRDQCVDAEVPFLFKQWGGRTPKSGGRELDGRTWDEYPPKFGDVLPATS